jgi:integrase/recombinase XerD
VSLETTNIYAEVDFETKAKALAKCDVPDTERVAGRWRDQPALMGFLRSL